METLSTIKWQYCMLITNRGFLSNNVDFTINFGEQLDTLKFNDEYLVQQTLDVAKYHTIVDAFNYMGSLGWEIAHVYQVQLNGDSRSPHQYLMKRKAA